METFVVITLETLSGVEITILTLSIVMKCVALVKVFNRMTSSHLQRQTYLLYMIRAQTLITMHKTTSLETHMETFAAITLETLIGVEITILTLSIVMKCVALVKVSNRMTSNHLQQHTYLLYMIRAQTLITMHKTTSLETHMETFAAITLETLIGVEITILILSIVMKCVALVKEKRLLHQKSQL